MSLRFTDPGEHAELLEAAKRQNVSLNQFVLSAALDKARENEQAFQRHFDKHMALTIDAFREIGDAPPADTDGKKVA